MKKTVKYRNIKIPLGPIDLIIVVGRDIVGAFDYIDKKFKGLTNFLPPEKSDAACVFDTPNGIFLFLRGKKPRASLLAHEVHHINFAVMTRLGVSLTQETDEIFGNHIQEVYQKIIDALKTL